MVGLREDATRLLAQQLQQAAAEFAKESAICVFNLVGLCQEFLLERNDAAREAAAVMAAKQLESEGAAAEDAAQAAANGAQSLWHEMQQRMQQQAANMEAELSTGPGISSLSGNVLGKDLWMFDGGLFADEGEQAGLRSMVTYIAHQQ